MPRCTSLGDPHWPPRSLASPTAARSFYYFVLPIYMWIKNAVWPRTGPLAERF